MNVHFYIQAILPIGMCYSLSLVLSNVVYLYLSMSFIQMLKVRLPSVPNYDHMTKKKKNRR